MEFTGVNEHLSTFLTTYLGKKILKQKSQPLLNTFRGKKRGSLRAPLLNTSLLAKLNQGLIPPAFIAQDYLAGFRLSLAVLFFKTDAALVCGLARQKDDTVRPSFRS